MAWTAEPDAGFGSRQPWLRFAPDILTRNVAAQAADPSSVLACYRRLLATRRASPALNRGTFTRLELDAPDVLAWRRRSGGERALVVINLADRETTVSVDGSSTPTRRLVGTHLDPPDPALGGGRLRLRPLEAVVAVSRTR